MKYFCRICGLSYDEAIWGLDNKTPSFDICCCCGVEFGYEDVSIESIRNYRKQWEDSGYPWFRAKEKPSDWNYVEQMRNIPHEFL